MKYCHEIELLLADARDNLLIQKYSLAERLVKRAIALYTRLPESGLDGPGFAYLMIELAEVYRLWSRFDRAEIILQKSLPLLESSDEETRRLLASAMNKLADLYLANNKIPQALPLLERALLVAEEWLDRHDALTLQITWNLALVEFNLNNLSRARALSERVREGQEALYGPRHLELADTLELLGTIGKRQRQFDTSERLLRRALTIRETLDRVVSEDVARVLRKLASVYCDKHDHKLAKPLLKKCLAMRKMLSNPQDEELACLYQQLAEIYHAESNYEPAELYLKKALSLRKKLLGLNSLETADTMAWMGKLYCALRLYDAAEANLNQALQIQMDILGPYNKEVAATLSKLAGVYMSQGRFNEANLMRDQAIACEVQHMQLKIDDYDSFDRAVVYHSQGQYEEAEEYYNKALARVERSLGSDHFHLAEILTKLAELHRSQKREDKAESLLLQALKIFQRMQHRAVINTYISLGDLYQHQLRFDEAEDLYQQALSMLHGAAAVRHSDRVAILSGYERLLLATGRKQEADKIRTRLKAVTRRARSSQPGAARRVKKEVT